MKVVIQRPPLVNSVFEAQLRELKIGSGWHVLEGLKELNEPYREGLPFLHKGYFDSHLHLAWVGSYNKSVDLRGCRSPVELVERVKAKLKHEKFTHLRGFGWHEDEMGIPLQALDKIFSDRLPEDCPILLERVCGHAGLVNKKYLVMTGVISDVNHPAFVDDRKLMQLREFLPKTTLADDVDAYLAGQKIAIENGISAVGEMSIDRARYLALKKIVGQGDLSIDVCGVVDGGAIAELESRGAQTIENLNPLGPMDRKARVSFRHWKKYLDGSLGARSAWLSRAYSDSEVFGDSLQKTKTLLEQSKKALEQGFYLSFHCIGDAAVDQALEVGRVLEGQMRGLSKGLSSDGACLHRLEHAQVLRDDQLMTIAKQDFWCVAAQPHHRQADASFIEQRLGLDRLNNMAYRAGSILNQKIPLLLGSDAPIDFLNPACAIKALCEDPRSQERLSLADAMWWYTTGGRLAMGLHPGVLERGATVFLTEPVSIF